MPLFISHIFSIDAPIGDKSYILVYRTISHRSVSKFFESPAVAKNDISVKPIDLFFSLCAHVEFHRVTKKFNGYFDRESMLA